MKIKDYISLDIRYKNNLEGSIIRWEKMVDFYYSGVKNKTELLEGLSITFPSNYKNEIILTKIEAEGLCPHHFLPTHYILEISYIPSENKVVGTSKVYMAFKSIVAQPLLMEDIFIEFFNEFWKRVKPFKLKMTMRGKYECNHKDNVSRDAEVILSKEKKRK